VSDQGLPGRAEAVYDAGRVEILTLAEQEEERGTFMKINRRKILAMLGMSPALLTEAQSKPAKGAAGAPTIEALNPRGIPPPITLVPMAPRLSSLDGKTIYLVSDGFPGADAFLNQIKVWFSKNMPSVITEFRLKAGGFADDDPKLFAEIKAKGNAVIMAIGH